MPAVMQRVADIVPSRWGFEANLEIEARAQPVDSATANFPVDHRTSPTKCTGALGVMFAFLLTVVLNVLKKRDVHQAWPQARVLNRFWGSWHRRRSAATWSTHPRM
jgi:hypothetical protein